MSGDGDAAAESSTFSGAPEGNGYAQPAGIDADLRNTGCAGLSAVSGVDEIAAAVSALGDRVAASSGTHAELLISAAIDHLLGIPVHGAERVILAAVKTSRARAKARAQGERRAATANGHALDVHESLPENVVPDSDLANGFRVKRDHGDELRFNPALGWLSWDGRRWQRGADAEAARRMHSVARGLDAHAALLLAAAARALDDVTAGRLRAQSALYSKWAGKSQQSKQIAAGLAIARTIAGIDCKSSDFDRDDWLLTCGNGTLDLRTGILRPHRREDLITRLAPVDFDPAAQCPRWARFLNEILPDEDTRSFVQKFLGYSLSGSMREQSLVVLYGSGSNGKSTFLEAVKYVMGDHAIEAAGETFLLNGKKGRSTDNKLADLRAARLVSSSESGEEHRLDETLVKRATGGDELTANHLYHETFRFHAKFKLWLCTNHRPEIRGVDEGVWRRMRLVPFAVTIPPERREGDLPAQLRAESAGILAWAVRGCLAWQREGLQPPAAVSASTADWRATEDDVAGFIADCCVVAEFAKVTSGALYKSYREWSLQQGGRPASAKAFGMRLSNLGYQPARDTTKRMWLGIGLAHQDHDA